MRVIDKYRFAESRWRRRRRYCSKTEVLFRTLKQFEIWHQFFKEETQRLAEQEAEDQVLLDDASRKEDLEVQWVYPFGSSLTVQVTLFQEAERNKEDADVIKRIKANEKEQELMIERNAG